MPSGRTHYARFKGLREVLLRSIPTDRTELGTLDMLQKAFLAAEPQIFGPSLHKQMDRAFEIINGRIAKEEAEIKEKQELVLIMRSLQLYFEKFML